MFCIFHLNSMVSPRQGIPPVLYENRFCNQDKFDIVLCGGRKSKGTATNEVIKLKGPEFQSSVSFTPMLEPRSSSKIAVIGSNIYVLGGYDSNYKPTPCNMYSNEKKQWRSLTPLFETIHYSVCSFMNCVYAVGGFEKISRCTNNCYKYEVKENKWYQLRSLQKEHFVVHNKQGYFLVTSDILNLANLVCPHISLTRS